MIQSLMCFKCVGGRKLNVHTGDRKETPNYLLFLVILRHLCIIYILDWYFLGQNFVVPVKKEIESPETLLAALSGVAVGTRNEESAESVLFPEGLWIDLIAMNIERETCRAERSFTISGTRWDGVVHFESCK